MSTNDKNRDMSMVVAMGEVNGKKVEVLKIPLSSPERFEYRIIVDDIIVTKSLHFFMSIEEAINHAISMIAPEIDEVVHVNEPDEYDLEALDALLYCGGANAPIKDLQELLSLHADFVEAVQKLPLVQEKAKKDFEKARSIIASTHGPFHATTLLVSELASVFESQTDVLTLIAMRNLHTIEHFLNNFRR